MQKTTTTLPEIKLVGITARTNNVAEMNTAIAKIGATIQTYFTNGLSNKIMHRKKPGTTYSAFTDYASDFMGDYTYFFGEEVTSFDDLPEGFTALTIPAQNYVKFTNGPGILPDVCLQIWQKVWTGTSEELGGERTYITDFELYDERAYDPQNVVLDVYVGIK